MLLINNDTKTAINVLRALERNEGYCPCIPERTPDTKCPCKDMREKQECHCKLYVKDDNYVNSGF